MNYRVVSYFLSIVCFFVAAAMSFCCLFAFPWLGHRSNEDYSTLSFERDGVRGLLCSVVVSLFAGFLLRHWAKGEKKEGLYRKEAMATVGLSWVIVTVLGGLPYMIASVKYAPAIRLESQQYAEIHEHKFHWRQNWESYDLNLSDQQYQLLNSIINDPEKPSIGMTVEELASVAELPLESIQQILESLRKLPEISKKLIVEGENLQASTLVRVEWIRMGIGDSMFESQSGFASESDRIGV